MGVFGGSPTAKHDGRVTAINQRNKIARQPLSKFERKALNQETEAVYIYNISPIFRWERFFAGLGNLILLPRKDSETVSEPLILAKRLVRHYDAGDRRSNHMVEEPVEIAEDFLRCSKEFPTRDDNNLTNYGCFMTVGLPIDQMLKSDQQRIIEESDLKHRNKCREKVFEADGWSNDATTRRWITEMQRKCALFLGEAEGRQWVTMRGAATDKSKTKECQFCGFDCKLTAVKCQNCREIIDQAGYDELKKKKA